jgi:hypothetical protein
MSLLEIAKCFVCGRGSHLHAVCLPLTTGLRLSIARAGGYWEGVGQAGSGSGTEVTTLSRTLKGQGCTMGTAGGLSDGVV